MWNGMRLLLVLLLVPVFCFLAQLVVSFSSSHEKEKGIVWAHEKRIQKT